MHMAVFIKEVVRSGTIASLVMMPPGFVLQALGMRVGHYGPKFVALFVEAPTPLFLFAQHLVLGWLSAIPLLLWLATGQINRRPVFAGAVYGAGYYVVVNSLGLPLWFGDPVPWQLGLTTVVPSLVVHIVYGASLGFTAKWFGFLSKVRQGSQTAEDPTLGL